MHAIAGAVNITAPDAIETDQDIAAKLRSNLFQFIRKPNYCFRPKTANRCEWPLLIRPVFGGNKLNLVSGLYEPMRKAF
jgi:hypothetical protein